MSIARVDEFQQPTRPWIESERSAALHAYGVLVTPRQTDCDELAQVASDICGAPIAVVNLIDTTRQFFEVEVGLGVRSTPLECAIRAHALLVAGCDVHPQRDERPAS